jgi:hypothetical protein
MIREKYYRKSERTLRKSDVLKQQGKSLKRLGT